MTYVDIKYIADRLDVCTRTVERMCKSGDFPAPQKIGKLSRWPMEVVDAWAPGVSYVKLGKNEFRIVPAAYRVEHSDGHFLAAFQTLAGNWELVPWGTQTVWGEELTLLNCEPGVEFEAVSFDEFWRAR